MDYKNKIQVIPIEQIQTKIYWIRGHKVMLDSDLAELYGVETKKLIQAVKRNVERFPDDFMLQLDEKEIKELSLYYQNKRGDLMQRNQEVANLRSQIVTSSLHGGRRYKPYVFTEQGVAMLSSVLRSQRAIKINVEIMRAFVKLRELLLSNETLARKLRSIEARTDEHAKAIIQIIEELQKPASPKKRRIGF